MKMRSFGKTAAAAAALVILAAAAALAEAQSVAPRTIPVVVDGSAPAHPFPHFWEQMFGSGRATLSLRDTYRRDMHQVRSVTGFRLVRFHGILDRDVGVYGVDAKGRPVYNFTYVDQI